MLKLSYKMWQQKKDIVDIVALFSLEAVKFKRMEVFKFGWQERKEKNLKLCK